MGAERPSERLDMALVVVRLRDLQIHQTRGGRRVVQVRREHCQITARDVDRQAPQRSAAQGALDLGGELG